MTTRNPNDDIFKEKRDPRNSFLYLFLDLGLVFFVCGFIGGACALLAQAIKG